MKIMSFTDSPYQNTPDSNSKFDFNDSDDDEDDENETYQHHTDFSHVSSTDLLLQSRITNDLFVGVESKRIWTRQETEMEKRFPYDVELYIYIKYHIFPYLEEIAREPCKFFFWVAAEIEFTKPEGEHELCTRYCLPNCLSNPPVSPSVRLRPSVRVRPTASVRPRPPVRVHPSTSIRPRPSVHVHPSASIRQPVRQPVRQSIRQSVRPSVDYNSLYFSLHPILFISFFFFYFSVGAVIEMETGS